MTICPYCKRMVAVETVAVIKEYRLVAVMCTFCKEVFLKIKGGGQ